MQLRRIIPIAIVLLLAIPVSAAWNGKGSAEPDSTQDRADGYMWPDAVKAQTPGLNAVYFNGFVIDRTAATTSESLNLATIGSAWESPNSGAMVMMGLWRDCNKDNYIGFSEIGYVYRAELLSDRTLCPPTPGVYPTHNDGTWVYEFLPITWNNGTLNSQGTPVNAACCDANALVDNGAHVWADAGIPATPTAGGCPTTPARGDATSTGRLLAWADCSDDNAVTKNTGLLANATGLNQLGLGRITFDDKGPGHQGESASVLNLPTWTSPFGKSTDQSYAPVWDCSNGGDVQHVNATDPTGGATLLTLPLLGPQSVHRQTVPGVVIITALTDDQNRILSIDLQQNTKTRAGDVQPGGSLAGTANQTDQGMNCNPNRGGAEQDLSAAVTIRGTPGDTVECPTLSACAYPRPADFGGRTRPDVRLISAQWPHKYLGYNTNDTVTDLSDKQNSMFGGDFRQYWYASDTIGNTGPLNRDGSLSAAHYITFYGFVSKDAVDKYGLTLKATAPGAYGADACALSAQDHVVRFNCDRTKWWKNADGTDIAPSTQNSAMCWDTQTHCDPRVFVGDPFNMRDIDCYDYDIAPLRDNGISPNIVLAGSC